jgi:hypothetical protein
MSVVKEGWTGMKTPRFLFTPVLFDRGCARGHEGPLACSRKKRQSYTEKLYPCLAISQAPRRGVCARVCRTIRIKFTNLFPLSAPLARGHLYFWGQKTKPLFFLQFYFFSFNFVIFIFYVRYTLLITRREWASAKCTHATESSSELCQVSLSGAGRVRSPCSRHSGGGLCLERRR